MAYTGPYPHTNAGSITAMLVTNTSFSGGVGNTGTIGSLLTGGIVVVSSTIKGDIINNGGFIHGGITIDSNSEVMSTGNTIPVDSTGGTLYGGIVNAGLIVAKSQIGVIQGNFYYYQDGLTNSGTITARNTGTVVTTASFYSGGITNTGNITSSLGKGVYVTAVGNYQGGITNGGTISAKQTGINVFNVTAPGGDISNSGVLTSTTGRGIYVNQASISFGNITNSGTISSKLSGIFVTNVSTFGGGITNTGTITGSAAIVVVGSTLLDGIYDSGTLASTGGAGGTAIFFNGGDQTLTLAPGYNIIGNVEGINGYAYTLQLGGPTGPTSQSGVFNLSSIGSSAQYQGFTNFAVTGARYWTLDGTLSQAELWTVTAGAEMDLFGALTISGLEVDVGGELLVGSGGTLVVNATSANSGSIDIGGGNAVINGLLGDAGTTSLSEGTLDVANGSISGQVFLYEGATLELDSSGNQVGSIGHIEDGDTVSLTFLAYSSAYFLSWSPNSDGLGGMLSIEKRVITIHGFNTVIETSVDITGGYSAANFSLSNSNNETKLTYTANGLIPSAATDVMLMDQGGVYEIYDIGQNSLLNAYQLVQTTSQWQIAGLGDFTSFSGNTGDTADIMMRNSSTGALDIYDMNNNNVVADLSLGQVGLEWTVAGFADFSGNPNETDMLMRDTATGAFQLYDISNNQFTGFPNLGQVGPEWSVAGFGDFSGHAGETDMMMRNTNTGAFELYDIVNNNYTGFFSMGQVGLEWTVAGIGNFSGNPNESDMIMRNTNTGAFEIYDITNNNYAGFFSMGQVGLEWTVAGFGDFSSKANETDMLMRNTDTGAFELYDISNNNYAGFYSMGQIGTEWTVAAIGPDTTGSTFFGNSSAQMTQAIASVSASGAGNTTASGTTTADPSHQTLLTTSQPG